MLLDRPCSDHPPATTALESSFVKRDQIRKVSSVIINRRTFNLSTLAASATFLADAAEAKPRSETTYGLISQFITRPEHRDELVSILAAATKEMPGCLSYVIAFDAARDDAIWVTEV